MRVLVILALLAVISLAALSLWRKPGTSTRPDTILRAHGKDGLPRARLNVDGTAKPAWQFNDAAQATKVAQNP